MPGRAGGGPIRRRSARQLGKPIDVKPYDPDVLQRHFHDDPMHLAIKRRDFDYVQEILDSGDNFCSREGLNCYKLAGDDPTNVYADTGLHGALSEMHRAIARHNFKLVQQLLDKGDTFCTADGPNCFILAASNKDKWEVESRWEMVEKMLRIHSRGILSRDEDGLTLLNYFWTELDIVKQLIDMGVDLNAVNKAGQTLCVSLFWAPLQNTIDDPFNEKDHLPQLWMLMMRHKEFQVQVVEHSFFRFFVTLLKKSWICQVLFFSILGLKLISIDLNFVKEYGEDVLIHLFCSDQSHKNHRHQGAHLKLWNILMKFKEFQDQVKEIDPEVPFSRLGQSDLAKQMFKDIDKLGLISVNQLKIKLNTHPLFYILEKNKHENSSYLSVIEFLLAEYSQEDNNSILKDKTILISKDISNRDLKKLSWLDFRIKHNISDYVAFDVISYFLYYLPDYIHGNLERVGMNGLAYYLTLFLKKGFVPVGTPGVVHPIHALLYNIFNRLDDDDDGDSSFSSFLRGLNNHLLPNLLVQAIFLLKDFPIPHQQVLDLETGYTFLDVHLLMSSLMTHSPGMFRIVDGDTPILDYVKALMPLSPAHPLQHFASFYAHQSKYDRRDFHVVTTYCQFLLYTFEVCGKHKFQAVDQRTIDCVNLFFTNFEKLTPDVKEKLKNNGLLISAPAKAEIEVGSLFWLSTLKIRKTLFLSRSSASTYLPRIIRTLIAEGYLPKGLEAELLIYEPNEKLNI